MPNYLFGDASKPAPGSAPEQTEAAKPSGIMNTGVGAFDKVFNRMIEITKSKGAGKNSIFGGGE
jgi:hypothetical protein